MRSWLYDHNYKTIVRSSQYHHYKAIVLKRSLPVNKKNLTDRYKGKLGNNLIQKRIWFNCIIVQNTSKVECWDVMTILSVMNTHL